MFDPSHRGPVVVGMDLGDASLDALRQGARIAAELGERMVVAHVTFDPKHFTDMLPGMGPEAEAQIAEARFQIGAALTTRVQRITGLAEGEFDVVVESGSPHARVVAIADDRKASLIVVAAKSHGALERLLLGSTADQIVRHARTPVLVARKSDDSGPIVAATDLSESANPAVAVGVELARRRGCKLIALHCLEFTHPAIAMMEPWLVLDDTTLASVRGACRTTLEGVLDQLDAPKLETQREVMVEEGRAARRIAAVAGEKKASLVVVATHGRSGLRRFAMGSVAAKVVREAPCSVLVVRPRASTA